MSGFDRRGVLLGAGALGAGAVIAACSSSTKTEPTASEATTSEASAGAESTSTKPAGTQIDASTVPVGGGRVLEDVKIVVTQPTAGQFHAFSAVCTHKGCTVNKVADGLIGQVNFVERFPNPGGLSIKRVQGPLGMWATADKLYIADTGNHRVIAIDHP